MQWRLRKNRAWAVVVAATASACAVQAPPSGGPVDDVPPSIVQTIPAADSTGISPGSSVAFTFSEPMRRAALEKSITFQPEVKAVRVKWDGNTMKISAVNGLHPDTTYVVTLKSGFRDAHNAENKSGYTFAFATAAAIDSGSVSGHVNYRREPSDKAVVRAFVLPKDSSFSVWSARPDRESKVSPLGEYELNYLPTRGNRILVWSFHDENKNGRYDGDKEHGAVYGDTIVLSALRPRAPGRDMWIIDPDEPGKVRGMVANVTGVDTLAVVVGLFKSGTRGAAKYLAVCGADGAFAFDRVHAGSYSVSAFVDFQADSLCGTYPCGADSTEICTEPCVAYPDSVRLEPGADIRLAPVELFLPGGDQP